MPYPGNADLCPGGPLFLRNSWEPQANMKRKQNIKHYHQTLPQPPAADQNQDTRGNMPPRGTLFGGGPPNSQPFPTPQPKRSRMGRTASVFSQEHGNSSEHQMNAGPMRSCDSVQHQDQFSQHFNSGLEQQQLCRRPEREATFFSRERRYPRNAEQQATLISPEGRCKESNSRSRSPQRDMRQTSPPAYLRAQLNSRHQLDRESPPSRPDLNHFVIKRETGPFQLDRESPPSRPDLNHFVIKRETGPFHSSHSSCAGGNSNQSYYQQQQADRSGHIEKHELYSGRQGLLPNEAGEPVQPVPNFSRGPAQPAGAEDYKPTTSSNGSAALGVADEFLNVYLKPVGHPEVKLSQQDKLNLEEAILQEVVAAGSNGQADPLRFNKIRFNGTFLKVTCANLASADWLMRTASNLRFYQGHPVEATRDEAPQPQRAPKRPKTKFFHVTVYFPSSADKSNEFIFGLIKSQNPYNTKLWGIASRKAVGEVAEIVLRIDQASAAHIAADGHKMHYRYGKIKVFGLKKRLAEIFPKGNNNDALAQTKPAPKTVRKKKPKIDTSMTADVQEVPNDVNSIIDLSFDEDAEHTV